MACLFLLSADSGGMSPDDITSPGHKAGLLSGEAVTTLEPATPQAAHLRDLNLEPPAWRETSQGPTWETLTWETPTWQTPTWDTPTWETPT